MMRSISLLVTAAALASCTYNGPSPYAMPSPSGQRAYQTLLTGKVPGPPVNCLPSYKANDMTVIDGRTAAFQFGPGTVYLMHFTQGCELAGSGNYALVSREFGTSGLCRGDIQQVVDTINHVNVGSCTIADIVPYHRP